MTGLLSMLGGGICGVLIVQGFADGNWQNGLLGVAVFIALILAAHANDRIKRGTA